MESALPLGLAVFALVAGAFFLIGSGESEHDRIGHRLASYAVAGQPGGLQQALSVLRLKRYSRIGWLDALLRRLDFVAALSRDLQRAGVPVRAGEFLLAQVAAAAVAAFGAPLLFQIGGSRLATIGMAAVLAFVAPRLWLRLKRAARLRAFEQELPEALDLVTGSLRAGYGVAHGLEMVAQEMPGPCAEEFGQVLQELTLGSDLDVALARVVERVDSEDARLLATAVAIQRRTGGNLVEVLGMISAMIRDRLRLRGEVRVLTTAPRVSGYVVACLPLLALVMTYFMSPYHIEVLFKEQVGHLMLAGGAALTLIGLFLNHKIAQVEL